jgi:hypothetical protein
MRVLTGILPVALLFGLAVAAAGADDSKDKDKAKENLKPNQVLMKVPGMH